MSVGTLVAVECATLGCSGSHGAPARHHDERSSAMDAAAPDGAASFALRAPVPNQWATLLDLCFLGLYTAPPISRMNSCVN